MAIKASNQISIVDVTDAYSVILTSEAYTFVGGTDGVGSGSSCTTQAVAYCGTNVCSTVTVDANAIKCPTGISASVTDSGTSAVTIKFTTTATISTDCEATIPVVVDGITINKQFSFAVAKTGAQGEKGNTGTSVSKVEVFYLTTSASSGVTTSTTGWSTTPTATTTTNKYIWSYQKITFSDNSTSTSTPAIIGTHGATGATGGTGATGNGISSVDSYYLTTKESTGVTVSTSGWGTSPTATTVDNKYMWMYQKITYTDKTTKNTTPAIISTHGATGAAGADAITVSITSSNGTVFKNSSGSTILTAHVYVAGTEKTITDLGVVADSLGSIKWYKGTSTTAAATAKTLTVSAKDIDNVAAYTCQLES